MYWSVKISQNNVEVGSPKGYYFIKGWLYNRNQPWVVPLTMDKKTDLAFDNNSGNTFLSPTIMSKNNGVGKFFKILLFNDKSWGSTLLLKVKGNAYFS